MDIYHKKLPILRSELPEIEDLLGDDWRFQNMIMIQNISVASLIHDNMPEVIDWPSNSPDLNPIENL
ncbi:hypothetical protein RclHR1_03360010 [Rhizophagus clarus]|uniref:Tc1-like transposase DDE domain-containing protein n=1 Tax=Rhizophagus clarus TaxID=94130 RepID=A0A2Z6R9W3_9GLOM|nr:hypothetical protein RclHR1_03360010 [Rhizophagus clarus]GES95805.1 hypothetical protein RCL_e15067_RclHR1_03360010 [Rhizophagus clarus]